MNEKTISILREVIDAEYEEKDDVQFPCKQGLEFFWTDCKEVALGYPAISLRSGVIIKVPKGMLKSSIEKFKSLSKVFGIPVKLETFEVDGLHFVRIFGWYSRDIIRSEVARLLFKSAVYNADRITSLDGFFKIDLYSEYFNPYFKGNLPRREFFSNLKANVEKQVSSRKLVYAYCGLFTWIQKGEVK